METKKTGTTTVGIKFKDGVVLATESKATMGNLIASKKAKKIYQIDDKIAVTTAGGVGDNQQLIRIIKAEINIYKLTRGMDITVNAASTLLSNILQGSRMFPRMAMLIIGGYDKNGPQLRSIDPLGGEGSEDEFVSTGSGAPFAYGVLENGFKPNMTEEQALELAIKSIKAAKERDAFSGGEDIQAVVITTDGLKEISKQETAKMAG
jgi:proteasome beta subunit